MEKPNPTTVAYYERAVPPDPRARKGAMFGHPCAFVNGNMFFGTFAQSMVIRLGETRTGALAKGKLRVFEPMPKRQWKEYLQVATGEQPAAKLATLAAEALEWTSELPPKPAKAAKLAKAKAKTKVPANTNGSPKTKAKATGRPRPR